MGSCVFTHTCKYSQNKCPFSKGGRICRTNNAKSLFACSAGRPHKGPFRGRKGSSMEQQTIKRGEVLMVTLKGELDHHTAASLRESIDAELTDAAVRELVFDMRAVTFMDSSGIGVLLGRYRLMRERGGTLAIRGANKYVERMIKMAGLSPLVQKQAR
ncbi:MAG: STAS domain-containing protein [Eubacteriales bacterium]|nr:STAS domain-containing protein [Eubacteriales bacterium]